MTETMNGIEGISSLFVGGDTDLYGTEYGVEDVFGEHDVAVKVLEKEMKGILC